MERFRNLKIWIILPIVALSLALVFSGCAVNIPNGSGIVEETQNTGGHSGDLKFSFAVFSDNGTINDVFKEVVSRTNSENVDFVLSVGDISEGKSRKSLWDYKNYMDENLGVPYYTAIGDNDLVLNSAGERSSLDFTQVIGPRNQSFDFDGTHFTILDSSVESEGIMAADLEWLRKDLQGHENELVFLFTHVPPSMPFSDSVLGKSDGDAQGSLDELTKLLTDAKVDHIYSGHFHGFMEYDFEGIPVTITGGAGSSPQFGLEPMNHFLKVDVYEQGYEMEVIKTEAVSR